MRACMEILWTIWTILQSLFLSESMQMQNMSTCITFALTVTLHLEFVINWIIIQHISTPPLLYSSGIGNPIVASETIEKSKLGALGGKWHPSFQPKPNKMLKSDNDWWLNFMIPSYHSACQATLLQPCFAVTWPFCFTNPFFFFFFKKYQCILSCLCECLKSEISEGDSPRRIKKKKHAP